MKPFRRRDYRGETQRRQDFEDGERHWAAVGNVMGLTEGDTMTTTATKDQEKPQTEPSTAIAPAAAPQTLPAAAPIAKTPVRLGIAPTSLDEGWRLAQLMAQSELVPKNFRGNPADVLVAIELGMEIGLPPMQALQSIAVINGKPGIYGDGFLAVIMSSPAYQDHDEYYEVGGQRCDGLVADDLKLDNTTAVCAFWRKGKALPVTRRFTIAQAKKADLLGKTGPWQTYPDRMLLMRARGFAGRDAFPDILRGIKTTEELMDTPDEPTRPEAIVPLRASEARAFIPPALMPAPPPPVAAVPEPSTPAAPLPGEELRALRIGKTAFVKTKSGEQYYEIHAAGRGVARIFVTRDEALYKEASSFEGTDHDVAIRWTNAVDADKQRVSVMLGLRIDEGNGLFS